MDGRKVAGLRTTVGQRAIAFVWLLLVVSSVLSRTAAVQPTFGIAGDCSGVILAGLVFTAFFAAFEIFSATRMVGACLVAFGQIAVSIGCVFAIGPENGSTVAFALNLAVLGTVVFFVAYALFIRTTNGPKRATKDPS